jgi:hypothetical protein
MYKYKNAGKIDEIRTWLITGSNYKSGAARKKLHQKKFIPVPAATARLLFRRP